MSAVIPIRLSNTLKSTPRLYCSVVSHFRPSFRRLIRLVPFIVLYGVAIYFVNNALGTNFFFMNGPAEGNPLTILERYIGGWYRIAFPIIAAIVWTIMYLPFRRPARS